MLLNKDGSNTKNNFIIVKNTENLILNNNQIIPLNYWLKNKNKIKKKNKKISIWLNSDENINSLKEDLLSIDLIALNFLKYNDGRIFSMAYFLRNKYNYKGHIQIIGSPIADQAQFLFRCGIDSIDIPNNQDIKIWKTESTRMSLFYQRSEQNNLNNSRY